MGDGSKYLAGAIVGAAITVAGFLLAGRPSRHSTVAPEGDEAHVAAVSERKGPAASRAGDAASKGPGLAVGGNAPSPAEATFLDRALRAERRRLAAASIRPEDSGLEVLRRLHDEKADVSGLTADFDVFASHMGHPEGKTVAYKGGEGVTKVSRDAAEGAVVLEFGPGVFVLEQGRGRWGDFREPVKSIEIRGAGMDATTLRVKDRALVFSGVAIESLRVKDLTFEDVERGGSILDSRGDASVLLERVRVREVEGGGGRPFYLAGFAYVGCRGCSFEGLEQGSAMHLRGTSIAFFEECTFQDLGSSVYVEAAAAREGRARYSRCTFEGTRLVDGSFLYRGRPAFPLFVDGGGVLYDRASLSDEKRREAWGAPYAAQVEGVSFARDPGRSTLGDLLRVADALAADATEIVTSVRLGLPARGGRPARYLASVWVPSRKASVTRAATMDGDRISAAGLGPGDAVTAAEASLVEGVRTLADSIRAAGMPLDADVRAFNLQGWWPAGGHTIMFETSEWDWPGWMLDAVTGAVLSRPGSPPPRR